MEILVVIAIIITLAGVSYTIFSKAGATSAATKCTAHLKQLHDYGVEFANQNGGKLPSSGMKDSLMKGREARNWWDALAPIANAQNPGEISLNEKVPHNLPPAFRCPDDARNFENKDTAYVPASADTVSYTSWLPTTKRKAISVASGKALYNVPWLSDGVPIDNRSVITQEDFDEIVAPAIDRHGRTIIVLYADGSIKKFDEPTFENIKAKK